VVVVNADLNADLVYQITRAIFESVDQLHKVHPSARSISVKSAVSNIYPCTLALRNISKKSAR